MHKTNNMISKTLYIISFVMILIFSSMNLSAQNTINTQKSNYIIDSIINYKLDNTHTYKFKFYYYDKPNMGTQLVKIEIFSNNSLFQTIVTKKEIFSPISQELIDYNFDGYKDISVRSDAGHGGWTFWIWKYSKKENKFIYDNQLSGNMGLELDKKEKNIVFTYRESWQHESWYTYKFVNDSLTWIKALDVRKYYKGSDFSKRVVESTYSSMVNGKKVIKTIKTYESQ